ncbi:acyl-CoA dehydrogenase family protein [Pedobacter westerhofensis]|nr:acyl-CoA dehydrogenase family protein [Pedobacter westerhofensis]
MMTDYSTLYQQLDQLAVRTEASGGMPAEEIRLLKQSGLLSIVLPGNELDFNDDHMPELLSLLKDVGRSNGAVGRIYEGHINTLFLIHLYATDQQRDWWYNQSGQHQKLFGVWNTDGATGISFAVDHSTVSINGSKGFCSGSSLVDYALIGGKTDQPLAASDWQMVVVPMDQVEEYRIDRNSWKPMGMKASVSHTIDFSGIILDGDAVLGAPGDYLRAPFFLSGAIRFAAVQLGMAEAVYNKTMSFLRSLNRLDDPFQKMRIGKMAMAIHTGQLWIQNAGHEFDRLKGMDEQHERLIAYAHLSRLTVESTCLEVLELSARCVGAKGLMAPGDLERWHRDLSYYLRQPAPDATLQNAAGYLIRTEDGMENCLMQQEETISNKIYS